MPVDDASKSQCKIDCSYSLKYYRKNRYLSPASYNLQGIIWLYIIIKSHISLTKHIGFIELIR